MNKREKEIFDHLNDKFPEAALEWVQPECGDSFAWLAAEKLLEIVSYLKETWEFSFDYLVNLSALDAGEHLEVVYHLYSYRHKHRFNIRIKASRENGEVLSLTSLYGAADFQEREVFDLFGLKFKGHPKMKRILLPDDWEGYPLLKDYQEKEDYQGIGTSRENLLN
jgi:NADH-quinone oxidoreductase subunit C